MKQNGHDLKVEPNQNFMSERKKLRTKNSLDPLNERRQCWGSPGQNATSSQTEEEEIPAARDIDYVHGKGLQNIMTQDMGSKS